MIASSAVLAVAGLALLFAPAETAGFFGIDAAPVSLQVLAALYLGSAAANWTARGSMIGGIYARPLSVGNSVHFFIGATVLIRELPRDSINPGHIAVSLVYLAFAVMFFLILFGRLGRKQ